MKVRTLFIVFAALLLALCMGFLATEMRARTAQAAASDYLAVSVPVTNTAANLKTVIDATLGTTVPNNWRELTIQVDPETSSAIDVRLGSSTLGTTVSGQIQKGATIPGGNSITVRQENSQILLSSLWVQTVTGTGTLNISAWSR